ncbi:MAG: hypothetical protein BGO82_05535 [Devosia sp. 67-54]|nr:MAG: hypothetical protein BGO82_05535 [Devosia sp. 67-54]
MVEGFDRRSRFGRAAVETIEAIIRSEVGGDVLGVGRQNIARQSDRGTRIMNDNHGLASPE